MKSLRALGQLAAASVMAMAALSPSVLRAADFIAVDRYVEGYIKENRLPGLALAIVEGDQVVYAKGYGIADTTGRPVTPQTPFLIGSTSKAFTALAVMQMVEAGKVDLDAPVQTYLPWFSMLDGAGGRNAASRITVRHLLNHTSGIPNLAGENALAVDDRRPDALEMQVRSFARVELARPTKTGMEYANANYQIAGLIVQTVSGEPFEEYVRQHIFVPLDMRHSYTTREEAEKDGLARGYRFWFGIPIAINRFPFPRGHFPSGYYAVSAEDMGHFLIAQINDGTYDGKPVISPAGMATMHKPVKADYAMGWFVNGKDIQHGGHLACYGSGMYIDMANRRGVAVLYNANRGLSSGHLYLVATSVANLLNGHEPLTPAKDTTYRDIIVIVLIALGAELAWMALSAWFLLPWMGRNRGRCRSAGVIAWLVIPLAVELGLAVCAPIYFDRQFNLTLAPLFQPDLYLLGCLLLAMLAGWGLIRTVWAGCLVFRRTLTAQGAGNG
jgi:CubicO group peptidase (beta-lactamase class C family)